MSTTTWTRASASRRRRCSRPGLLTPSITEEDVRRFLAKQKVKQDLTRKRREGSYVASAPREEFQADLADFGERASPRYGLACIDVFSRLATIIPLADKNGRGDPQCAREGLAGHGRARAARDR